MSHFAKISEQNEILDVLSFDDDSLISDENGVESEIIGQQYLEKNHNWPAHLWIKTSYNTFLNKHRNNGIPYRGNYATIGGTWDPVNNMFFNVKPYSSWVKNLIEARWQSPIGDAPILTDEEKANGAYEYVWNEVDYQTNNTTGWKLVTETEALNR
jgi:hypothetical protein